ncbi:MAG: right-handed parallel beta-helix repeat-containing protein [Nanoarchaeota archaeon]|nr:right-handed parallel beta-helix repeat-containing protein [Nanoarchaeota archaeon]
MKKIITLFVILSMLLTTVSFAEAAGAFEYKYPVKTEVSFFSKISLFFSSIFSPITGHTVGDVCVNNTGCNSDEYCSPEGRCEYITQTSSSGGGPSGDCTADSLILTFMQTPTGCEAVQGCDWNQDPLNPICVGAWSPSCSAIIDPAYCTTGNTNGGCSYNSETQLCENANSGATCAQDGNTPLDNNPSQCCSFPGSQGYWSGSTFYCGTQTAVCVWDNQIQPSNDPSQCCSFPGSQGYWGPDNMFYCGTQNIGCVDNWQCSVTGTGSDCCSGAMFAGGSGCAQQCVPGCNNNQMCENYMGENINNCPSDCSQTSCLLDGQISPTSDPSKCCSFPGLMGYWGAEGFYCGAQANPNCMRDPAACDGKGTCGASGYKLPGSSVCYNDPSCLNTCFSGSSNNCIPGDNSCPVGCSSAQGPTYDSDCFVCKDLNQPCVYSEECCGSYTGAAVCMGNLCKNPQQQDVECGPTPTDNCIVTQNTVFNPGTYNLPSGIRMSVSDVTLDCNGATLIGPGQNSGSNGIQLVAANNINIKNCNIKDYNVGIMTNAINTLNIDSVAITNTNIGMEINNAFGQGTTITNSRIDANTGIQFHGGEGVLVENVAIQANFGVIALDNTQDVLVTNNQFSRGQYPASFPSGGATNVTISNNMFNGVRLQIECGRYGGCNDFEISGNTFENYQQQDGNCFGVNGPTNGFLVSDNTFRNAYLPYFSQANGLVFSNNLIEDIPGNAGVAFEGGSGLIISGNTIRNAPANGIEVKEGNTNSQVINNIIENATQVGIMVYGGVTLDKISGNKIRNAQCPIMIMPDCTQNVIINNDLDKEICDGDASLTCEVGQTQACGSDVGICSKGAYTCNSVPSTDPSIAQYGRWAECTGGIKPEQEICNELDDDCDGISDNNIPGTVVIEKSDITLMPATDLFTGSTDIEILDAEGVDLDAPTADLWYMVVAMGDTPSATLFSENLITWAINDGKIPFTGDHSGKALYFATNQQGQLIDCASAKDEDFYRGGGEMPAGLLLVSGPGKVCAVSADDPSEKYELDIKSIGEGLSSITLDIYKYVPGACLDTQTYYQDSDNDGFGNINVVINARAQPDGYVLDGSDCDDSNAFAHPEASDMSCNNVDEDCSGVADDGYVSLVTVCGTDLCSNEGTFSCIDGVELNTCAPKPPVLMYQDNDQDLYGGLLDAQEVCSPLQGYVFVNSDCNDGDSSINPESNDICNANHAVVNKDCKLDNDNELNCQDYCGDIDGDGFVTEQKWGDWNGIVPSIICPWIKDGGECNDMDGNVNPQAAEICDSVDNNCNGKVDEGCAAVNKGDVLSLLQSLNSADAKSKSELSRAVTEVTQSLGNRIEGGDKKIVWADSTSLACRHGQSVFDDEKKAVDHLEKVTDPLIKADVDTAISLLVSADKQLAELAIKKAPAGSTKDKAVEKFNKAASETVNKHKIQAYREAWKYLNNNCDNTKKASCIDEITMLSPSGDYVTAIGDEVGYPNTAMTDIYGNKVSVNTNCNKCIAEGQLINGWKVTAVKHNGALTPICSKK